MLDTAFYLVSRDIAVRSGVVNERYRTADGRFVLDNKDLGRIRFTSDEFVSGLKGIERVDRATAYALIQQNGNKRGPAEEPAVESMPAEEPVNEEVTEEATEGMEPTEDTPAEDSPTEEEPDDEQTSEGKEEQQ